MALSADQRVVNAGRRIRTRLSVNRRVRTILVFAARGRAIRWGMTTGILLAIWLAWNSAGNEALDGRRYAEAVTSFQQAIAASENAMEENDPRLAMMWRNLAIAYSGAGLERKAERAALRSVGILETRFGPLDPSLVPSLNALGEALAMAGRYTEARHAFERAVKLNLAGPHGATAVHNLAAMAQVEGRTAKAARLYEEALRQRVALLGEDHPATVATQTALGTVSRKGNDRAVAARRK